MAQIFYSLIAVITVVALILEITYSYKKNKGWYDVSDFMNNMHISIGQLFWGAVLAPLTFYCYHLIHSSLGYQGLKGLLHPVLYFTFGLVLTEFCQYWMHRYSHKINILIAGHITHHSSGHYNMSTGIRINWFYRAIAWTAYIPLALIGYDVQDFLLFQVIMNSYNLYMHTQYPFNFGWLRYLLVTPSFHKVHHAANLEYRDKNFGALFSFFDLIFGTYVEEKKELPCRFGISKNVESTNPLWFNFHYLVELHKKAKLENKNYLKLLFSSDNTVARIEVEKPKPQLKFPYFYLILYGLLILGGTKLTALYTKLPLSLTLLIILAVSCLLVILGSFIQEKKEDQAKKKSLFQIFDQLK